MKLLTTYEADAGTCVINGIGIDNGFGDGKFGVYYSNKLPKGFEIVKDLWIDLRDGYGVTIHGYDCNKKGNEVVPNKLIPNSEFGDAQALQVAVKYGKICFVKYF